MTMECAGRSRHSRRNSALHTTQQVYNSLNEETTHQVDRQQSTQLIKAAESKMPPSYSLPKLISLKRKQFPAGA